MTTRKADHPAMIDLRGIITVLDSQVRKGKSITPEALGKVREMTLSAMQLLEKPDPKTERLCLVALMLRESTKVEEKEVRGKLITRVHILDQIGYNWAMSQIHQISSALKKIK